MSLRVTGIGLFENNAARMMVASLSEDIISIGEVLLNYAMWNAYNEVCNIVAAECVAAICGAPSGELPPELAAMLPAMGDPTLEVLHLARSNVREVITCGQLIEFWEQRGEGVEY
ncbi:hypothetical protein [Erythrobacter mangrovi]|uniref:Uncharacterized protein n=1 Tax=Erythrobacter mangrovi TaxID=2739433 RepID=A0A7D4BAA8_9SPHN|nr:hypothetical protein [Erythrobacter mangrovi]QKG70786.1 hypothetical protein HQR01_05045 [Erythrobacter mangrovi]